MSMFEVGKSYRIHWDDGDGLGYTVYEVLEVEGPCIKVSQPGRREIINTTSPHFFKAEVVDDPDLQEEGRNALSDFQIDIQTSKTPD